MDLRDTVENAIHVQYRLIRTPLTIFEMVTGRGEAGQTNTREREARQGMVEEVVGRAKEVVGTILGNDSMLAQGQLEQKKGEERREAVARETIAERRQEKAAEDYRRREARVEAERRETEREKAEKQAQIDRQRNAAKQAVEQQAKQREEVVERQTRVKQQAVRAQEQAAREARKEEEAAAAGERFAADQAKRRAEELEAARKNS